MNIINEIEEINDKLAELERDNRLETIKEELENIALVTYQNEDMKISVGGYEDFHILFNSTNHHQDVILCLSDNYIPLDDNIKEKLKKINNYRTVVSHIFNNLMEIKDSVYDVMEEELERRKNNLE